MHMAMAVMRVAINIILFLYRMRPVCVKRQKKREVGQSISESPTIHVAGPHRKHLKMHERPMVMDNIPTLNELEPT